MKNILILLFTAIISDVVWGQQEFEKVKLHVERINAVADSIGADQVKSGATVGISLAVAVDGKVIYSNGFGVADVGMGIEATNKTVYPIASITKQFTAASILKLVEEGRISLDDPLLKFFPNYPAQAKGIKIHHLLNHTSGIKNYSELDGTIRKRLDFGLSEAERINLFANEPLEFQPGEDFRYSNSGYYLLGIVISRVTGLPFGKYVEQELFEPHGLKNTSYCEDETVILNRAEGYEYDKNGELIRALPTWFDGAAGSICSTVEDLVLWNKLLHSGKIISLESLRKMTSPTIFNNGNSRTYGYGLDLAKLHGHSTILHSGEQSGYQSYLTYYPKAGLTVAVLSNSGRAKPEQVEEVLTKTAFGIKLNLLQDLALTENTKSAYEGVYVFPMGEMKIYRNESKLYMEIPVAGVKDRLRYQGDDLFVPLTDDKVTLKFLPAEDNPKEMVIQLKMGGKEFVGKLKD